MKTRQLDKTIAADPNGEIKLQSLLYGPPRDFAHDVDLEFIGTFRRVDAAWRPDEGDGMNVNTYMPRVDFKYLE